MVTVLLRLLGSDPRGLAESLSFVCALRAAMSRISGVPLSELTVASVSMPSTGLRIIMRVAQQAGSCGARALSQSKPVQRQLQARLIELELEVVLDASRTTLTAVPSNAEAAVQAALRATFADPAAVDAAFGDVLQTACPAQGITQSCPNPPSLALRLAPPATLAASSSTDMAALAGGLAAGMLLCLCMMTSGCLYQKKQNAVAPLTISPPPTASSTSVADFSYDNPNFTRRQGAPKI